ncbi:MAG: hypothetical protein EHM55_05605 [Acidobacteria bacterium]|nr:MAG: hypothetical protein EHM55_05605 [Acidobacteriota bacterium]
MPITHTSKRNSTTGRVGRPPAGDDGQRVKDYPQVSFRLPRTARDKLVALSKITKQPQWRLIVESMERYLRDLPRNERIKLARLLSRSKRVQH